MLHKFWWLVWHYYIVRFFKFLYVFWHDVHLSKTWRKHSTLIECGFIMKERHPIISALEHQIRIQHEIISKNDFSRSIKMYQNEKHNPKLQVYLRKDTWNMFLVKKIICTTNYGRLTDYGYSVQVPSVKNLAYKLLISLWSRFLGFYLILGKQLLLFLVCKKWKILEFKRKGENTCL